VTRGFRGGMFVGLMLLAAGHIERLNAQEPAATTTGAEITFTFERSGLPVPRYTLSVDETGDGTYKATDATGSLDRAFKLTDPMAAKIFALVHAAHIAPQVCASKAKNVADTGAKTLAYVAGETTAACSYNYSENKDVQQLTTIFEGIAETLDEGRTLERLHRFDRLGLDAEMISYSDEVAAGRALEMGTITACLRSIADDPEVIQRVRTRAAKLLGLASPNAASR
jgi:hypothetical protein